MTEFSALRQHAGVTIPELAAQLGFPEIEVANWEEGRSEAPKHVIHVLDFMIDKAEPERSPVAISPTAQQSFPWFETSQSKAAKTSARTGAFSDNMKLPIHRWFRYSAGFSAEWVTRLVEKRQAEGIHDFLFDPFAGSGTSLLAAQAAGVPSAGAERHPFVYRIAQAKLLWNCDTFDLIDAAEKILANAKQLEQSVENSSELLARCYSPDALQRLLSLRSAYVGGSFEQVNTAELLWLALTSILRECSGVGTAQWQYLLPNKTKARVVDPYAAFQRRIAMFAADIAAAKRVQREVIDRPELKLDDARHLGTFDYLAGRVTCVVTSPPYPNNFDYADATRLEMTFWGEVSSWGDLHRTVRHQLVRSCSQHSAAEKLQLEALLDDQVLEPIKNELSNVCSELAEVRETKGGKKTYHTMVAAYFADLGRVWIALRRLCADNADVCFVIGDSAPYGVYVPADEWLAALAIAAGFSSPRFEKIRDRNLKWKNRKHRVPLKEGNLWLKG